MKREPNIDFCGDPMCVGCDGIFQGEEILSDLGLCSHCEKDVNLTMETANAEETEAK